MSKVRSLMARLSQSLDHEDQIAGQIDELKNEVNGLYAHLDAKRESKRQLLGELEPFVPVKTGARLVVQVGDELLEFSRDAGVLAVERLKTVRSWDLPGYDAEPSHSVNPDVPVMSEHSLLHREDVD